MKEVIDIRKINKCLDCSRVIKEKGKVPYCSVYMWISKNKQPKRITTKGIPGWCPKPKPDEVTIIGNINPIECEE